VRSWKKVTFSMDVNSGVICNHTVVTTYYQAFSVQRICVTTPIRCVSNDPGWNVSFDNGNIDATDNEDSYWLGRNYCDNVRCRATVSIKNGRDQIVSLPKLRCLWLYTICNCLYKTNWCTQLLLQDNASPFPDLVQYLPNIHYFHWVIKFWTLRVCRITVSMDQRPVKIKLKFRGTV
jgi:hypothetical protein